MQIARRSTVLGHMFVCVCVYIYIYQCVCIFMCVKFSVWRTINSCVTYQQQHETGCAPSHLVQQQQAAAKRCQERAARTHGAAKKNGPIKCVKQIYEEFRHYGKIVSEIRESKKYCNILYKKKKKKHDNKAINATCPNKDAEQLSAAIQ